jgi:ABC-type Fe3+-hydroxamate transport system substrate-binding protein
MPMLRILDDRERELVFHRPPERVVSLVPSDTLSLFDLGAGDRVVGRTRYCLAPEGAVERVPVVGGTKDPDPDAIADLRPELVIVNQEENTQQIVKQLAERAVPVLICFPKTVGEGIAHLARLARILGLEGDARARQLLQRVYTVHGEAEARLLGDAKAGRAPLKAFVPIWMKPLMTISGETFFSDALRLAGASNVFAERRRRYPLAADQGRAPELPPEQVGDRDTRYPRITSQEVVLAEPEVVLLPDEPHPFSEEDAAVFRGQDTPAARAGKVRLIGGRDLSWYGAQSAEGIGRLRALVDSLR